MLDVYLIVMGYVWGLNQKHAGDRGFQKQVFRIIDFVVDWDQSLVTF